MQINKFLSSLVDDTVYFSNVKPQKIKTLAENRVKPIIDGKTYNRLLIIGDMHGMFNKAVKALTSANITENDFLISLGDYTDRGLQNNNCEKLLVKFFQYENIKPLMGNHELMLIQYFLQASQQVTGQYFVADELDDISNTTFQKIIDCMCNEQIDGGIYVYNGGAATLSEILNIDFFKTYLKTLFKLDKVFDRYFGKKHYLFAHAGINPNKRLSQQSVEDLLWIRNEFFDNYQGEDIVCIGHTPVQTIFWDNKPHFKDNIIFMDTGSFIRQNGQVTVLDVLNNEYWQG